METAVTKVRHDDGRAVSVIGRAQGGGTTEYACTDVISSMPISQLLEAMDPPVPDEVRAAADDLRYRDFLTVALVVPAEKVAWTDNWIYIHDPDGEDHADPELRLVVAVPGQGRPQRARASSTRCWRATTTGTPRTRS